MHHKNDQYGDTHSDTGSQNNFGEDENSGGHVVKYNNTPVVIRRNDNKIDLKLFVGQISKNWDEKEVTSFFSKFGDIMESQILKDKSGNSKGCAFVKFSSMTRAERAIEELTKTKVILPGANATIQIRWADGEPERLGMDPEMNFKLFVGSIPREASEQNLRDLFERFGKIEELHLMREPDGITSRGSAFIKYALRESALLAIKNLHAQAYILNSDKPIEVRLAEKPKRTNQPGPAAQPMDQNKHMAARVPSQQQGGMGYPMPVTYNPMYGPQMIFYHYKTAEGVSYYWNPMTMVSTYEKPPQGSVVYNMFEPTTMAPTTTPYIDMTYSNPAPVHTGGTLNDLSDQNNSKKQGPAGANLFIFHLPNYWKDSDLFSLFRYYGSVLSARIMTEKGTGKSKGYGFVSYERQEDAQKAIEALNGYKVEGKRLKVEVKKGEGEEGSISSLGNKNFQAY